MTKSPSVNSDTIPAHLKKAYSCFSSSDNASGISSDGSTEGLHNSQIDLMQLQNAYSACAKARAV